MLRNFPGLLFGRRRRGFEILGSESENHACGTIFIPGWCIKFERGAFVDFPRRKRRRFVCKHLVFRSSALARIRLSAFFFPRHSILLAMSFSKTIKSNNFAEYIYIKHIYTFYILGYGYTFDLRVSYILGFF